MTSYKDLPSWRCGRVKWDSSQQPFPYWNTPLLLPYMSPEPLRNERNYGEHEISNFWILERTVKHLATVQTQGSVISSRFQWIFRQIESNQVDENSSNERSSRESQRMRISDWDWVRARGKIGLTHFWMHQAHVMWASFFWSYTHVLLPHWLHVLSSHSCTLKGGLQSHMQTSNIQLLRFFSRLPGMTAYIMTKVYVRHIVLSFHSSD